MPHKYKRQYFSTSNDGNRKPCAHTDARAPVQRELNAFLEVIYVRCSEMTLDVFRWGTLHETPAAR